MAQNMRYDLRIVAHFGSLFCRVPALSKLVIGHLPKWTGLAPRGLALLIDRPQCTPAHRNRSRPVRLCLPESNVAPVDIGPVEMQSLANSSAAFNQKTGELHVLAVFSFYIFEQLCFFFPCQKTNACVAFRQFSELRKRRQSTVAMMLTEYFGQTGQFSIDRGIAISLSTKMDRQTVKQFVVKGPLPTPHHITVDFVQICSAGLLVFSFLPKKVRILNPQFHKVLRHCISSPSQQ